MLDMNRQKEREGDELFKRAEEALKTALFKWSVSHTKAADNYEAAATAYACARSVDKARRAWRAAAEEHVKSRNSNLAARCLDQLGSFDVAFAHDLTVPTSTHTAPRRQLTQNDESNIHTSIQCLSDAVQAYQDSAELYTSIGNGAREADMLLRATEVARESTQLDQMLRAARSDGGTHVEEAVRSTSCAHVYVQLAWKTIHVMERNVDAGDGRRHRMSDVYRQLLLFHIRRGETVEAVDLLKYTLGHSSPQTATQAQKSVGIYDKERNYYYMVKQPENAGKAGLEMIILCLSYHGDVCWARLEFDRMRAARVYGFVGSKEERAAEALITAYEQRDEQQIHDALNGSHCVNFILPDVSRMAKKLTMSGVTGVANGKSCSDASPAAVGSDREKSYSVASSSTQGNAKEQQRDARGQGATLGTVERHEDGVGGVHSQASSSSSHTSEPEIDPEEDLR